MYVWLQKACDLVIVQVSMISLLHYHEHFCFEVLPSFPCHTSYCDYKKLKVLSFILSDFLVRNKYESVKA